MCDRTLRIEIETFAPNGLLNPEPFAPRGWIFWFGSTKTFCWTKEGIVQTHTMSAATAAVPTLSPPRCAVCDAARVEQRTVTESGPRESPPLACRAFCPSHVHCPRLAVWVCSRCAADQPPRPPHRRPCQLVRVTALPSLPSSRTPH